MPYPFIDIEASGFGSSSYPIEVGFVLADGSGYCTLIRPEPEWQHWDADAEKVHGISREVLFKHGKAAAHVAETLNERLGGKTVFTDGWYHDFNWIHRLFDAADLMPSFTLQDLRGILRDGEADKWHAVKAAVESELQLPRHRASHDARILQTTYQKVHLSDNAF